MSERVQGKVWARPGVKGAFQDLIESLAKATGPRSLMHRHGKVSQAQDDALNPPSEAELRRRKIAEQM